MSNVNVLFTIISKYISLHISFVAYFYYIKIINYNVKSCTYQPSEPTVKCRSLTMALRSLVLLAIVAIYFVSINGLLRPKRAGKSNRRHYNKNAIRNHISKQMIWLYLS